MFGALQLCLFTNKTKCGTLETTNNLFVYARLHLDQFIPWGKRKQFFWNFQLQHSGSLGTKLKWVYNYKPSPILQKQTISEFQHILGVVAITKLLVKSVTDI